MSKFELNNRIKCERKIVEQVVGDLLLGGLLITVNDGEEDVLMESKDFTAIMAALFSTDEDRLYVHKKLGQRPFGWVKLIYGNDGPDVINDYTTNLEDFVKGANELANRLEEEGL